MASILITKKFNLSAFHDLSAAWRRDSNISFTMERGLTDSDANRIAGELLEVLPDEAGFCLLENLIDIYNIDDDLLMRLFSFNDISCNVSICLRDNLSEVFHQLCAKTSDQEVREHYFRRHPSESDKCG